MKVLAFLALSTHQICFYILSFTVLKSITTTSTTIFLLLSLSHIQPSFALNRPNSSSTSCSTSSSFRSNSEYSHKETNIHRQTAISSSSSQNELKEQEKYSSLPHTIFSSKGRLYNVEKASLLSSNEYDITSSLVLALKFGGESGEGGCDNESILVLSSCPKSPYLQFNDNKESGKSNDNDNKRTPLWQYNTLQQKDKSTICFPISILSANLLIGIGGKSIDTIIIHDKILELYLSHLKSMDGMRSTHRIESKVISSYLARKVADSLQVYTQDVSLGYGRILSVSSYFL